MRAGELYTNIMIYHEPKPISREQAEAQFATGLQVEICDALARITYNHPDWRWAQNWCLFFTEHPDYVIRGVAANCLGDLARIHRCLELDKVFPVLKKLLCDPKVAGRVEDALDDIRVF